ncbi:MAG TPA: hypothetical protein VJX67_26695 [Blastocatellia bacterium]|nr:hypothetical protein [Blastocatellia bacterium]
MSEDNIASFQGAIGALTGWLEEDGIPYTLIGGIAVSLLSTRCRTDSKPGKSIRGGH